MPDMSFSSGTALYPCDRGMQGGPRGFHDYATYPGGQPTCRYCGATRRPSFGSPSWPAS